MNGKQAKMLRRMRATSEEISEFKRMNAGQRGLMRRAFNDCPWMMYPSFTQTKRSAERARA